MPDTRIYLSPPHMQGAEQSFIEEAFASNWISSFGDQLDKWEQELSAKLNVKEVCLLNTCTAAIHLCMDLLDVGPGDLVLTQSLTFCGSAFPITYRGATPVFIDSEEESWNMSATALEAAIVDLKAKGKGDKLKAIMPVHLYGMPANMDKIMAVAEAHNIPVIEDAAESLGSTYKGVFTGTLGKLGVYSFNGNKIITTSGGGALVSNDKQLVDRAYFLSTQARDDAPHYQHTVIGYNYRMSNVLAGIGRGQMKVLDERIAQRRKNFERYKAFFSEKNKQGYAVQFQKEAEGSYSNRWLSCILIDPERNKGITREKVRLALEAENIEARPLWKPMHLQPVFVDALFYGGEVSEKLFDIGLCLPSGSNLTETDFERILGVLDRIM